jgi:hypothetical protein
MLFTGKPGCGNQGMPFPAFLRPFQRLKASHRNGHDFGFRPFVLFKLLLQQTVLNIRGCNIEFDMPVLGKSVLVVVVPEDMVFIRACHVKMIRMNHNTDPGRISVL